MNLRERNAAQTRELILDTALPLFLERGYDSTTMEQIAERAGIGTSTLYRYFPSKDALVLEPLSLRGHLAAELSARPAAEPLESALGHCITALVAAPRGNQSRLREVGAVIASAPAVQARLLEEFVHERTLLEQAIADRLDRPHDDTFCVITARLAIAIVEVIGTLGDGLGDIGTAGDPIESIRRITDQLRAEPPAIPRLEAVSAVPAEGAD